MEAKGDSPITKPRYSIVIPAYDEGETLEPLYEQIVEAMNGLEGDFEILFIDDGSKDNTFDVLKSLNQNDPRIRALRFRSNQGKAQALAAGFEEVRGDIVITMDADLQDDPNEISHLVEKMNEGYDLVSGWKKERHDPLSKKLFSKVFNYVVSWSSGIPLHDFNCGLKCYRYEVTQTVRLYGELHRFIPVLASKYGWRITEIPVTHHPRRAGKSKYGSERVLRGLFDFCTVTYITKFMRSPLYLFGRWGMTLGFFAFCGFIVSLLMLYNNIMLGGGIVLATSAFLGIMGVQSIFFGLLGEMLTYLHRDHVSPYYVNERLG